MEPTTDQRQTLRLLYLEYDLAELRRAAGKSIRQTAMLTGLSWQTVKNAETLRDYWPHWSTILLLLYVYAKTVLPPDLLELAKERGKS